MDAQTKDKVEEIELEVWSTENVDQPVPEANWYIIRVDKEKFTVEFSCLTGREILILAGKEPPEEFELLEILQGNEPKPVKQDQKVDFRRPGVERFVTLPLDQTDG
ncbi:MAG: hypothetical protein HN377_03970 [Alphaproteobacteria bacterium]|jgi:hypothetical protein|nr:hypothetical protein [Alphaproteobacteria bacterium]MBT7943964.1 hypothetical protein [Alphaproteobacteria bacterium]